MKKLFFVIGLLAVLAACSENKSTAQSAVLDPNVHKVIAIETINTSKYTYVKVNENGTEKWIAGPLADIKVGAEYYYGNEMPMANFVSKELNRTFEMVYFVEGISSEPPTLQPANSTGGGQNMNPQPLQAGQENEEAPAANHAGSAGVKTEKEAVSVKPAKGGITIAELISNKEKYAGKKVVIKGKVTKYNEDVMDRNWIHIQDGTEINGKFDLTITSKNAVKVGDMVTFEGVIVINKDFGAGYVYEILLEEASLLK
jgi:hypothetical protein